MVVGDRMQHAVFLYDDPARFLAGVGRWVAEGLAADEAVVIVAGGAAHEAIRGSLGVDGDAVAFADMEVIGANPARVIGAVRRFVESGGGRRVRALGLPMWPGRTPAQQREVIAHEAAVNLAFADSPISFLCAYDTSALPAAVVSEARRVHPQVWTADGYADCPQYDMEGLLIGQHPPARPDPLTEPLGVIVDLAGLAVLRVSVAEIAEDAGLSAQRRDELVVAVNEVATNALAHTAHPAFVSRGLDRAEGSLVVEVATHGCIADPLVGRELRPSALGGRGLWIVNQLCDLVETRSGPWGSLTRLHIHLL